MGSMAEPRPELRNPWVETPLNESAILSKAAGCRVFLKLENLQPSGSFKSRGIGNLMLQAIRKHPPHWPIHFYSSSGGNAGLACVTAARTLGYPATVVVPLSTKPMMIAKIRTAGATEVVQTGATWREADKHLREEVLAKDKNGVYVPPFDHQHIWDGNSLIIDELASQMHAEKPDALICSVGGGGLFSGLMQGLDKHSWDAIDVLAVETEGTNSLYSAVAANQLVTLPSVSGIATSLACTRVAEKAFQYGRRSNVKCVVLADAEAAMGCWRFADDERMLVDAACGAPLALCYDGRLKRVLPGLAPESKVVVVVCGGSIVTLDILAEYRREFGYIEKMTTSDEGVPSTFSGPNGQTNGEKSG